jgi:RHS repeat-associated protein
VLNSSERLHGDGADRATLGRRIARNVGGQWTYMLSDVAGNPLSELAFISGSWVRLRDYVWLEYRPLAQVEYTASPTSGQGYPYYFHLDHIGFPRALTNAGALVVWTAGSTPHGEITETTNIDPASGIVVVTNLRLPGQYDERLLASLGVQGPYYNWHRWYLPSIGRYLELDPPALKGLLDIRGKILGPAPEWYTYARGNPLRYTDPKGLYGTKCCTFYERRCAQSGGTSTYFCTLANSVCNAAKKGDTWSDCVRKCLQDMDRVKRNDSDKDKVCKPLPYTSGDFTADHALCFGQCAVDTDSNPFNSTSEPNDDNCEH